MQLDQDRVERIQRLAKAWAEAEEAMKICEQQLGNVIIPAVFELRYAGRKLARSLENYSLSRHIAQSDLEIEDAIFDCHRARHDSSDAATTAISQRIDLAVTTFGAKQVNAKFPDYLEIVSSISMVREKIAAARKDGNGRHELYEGLEASELPRIVKLFEKFKAAEPLLERRKVRDFLIEQGLTIGTAVAIFIALAALYVELNP